MSSKTSMPDKFYIFAVVLIVTTVFLTYDLYNSDMYQCTAVTYLPPSFNEQRPRVFNKLFNMQTLDRDLQFDMNGNDVMVVLHIQKTGGSDFERHLIHLQENPCNCSSRRGKQCDCYRPGLNGLEKRKQDTWLFTRYSSQIGWRCGLHADWTELTSCVPKFMEKKSSSSVTKRRYLYVTTLRNPVHRYISEWQHVQRGATWNTSRHMCNGRLPSEQELPKCYKGRWLNVSLDEFMNCKYNLANNRQTRMLADLSLVGCYNHTKMPQEERNQIMLRSAKHNLRKLAFFGLTEFQAESQFVFEETFKLNFEEPLKQYNSTLAESTSVTQQQYDRIRQVNYLDLDLYEFARTLFFQRKIWMEHKKKTSEG